jgi:protocatechuate 3,4-dioxygenase beta subunit
MSRREAASMLLWLVGGAAGLGTGLLACEGGGGATADGDGDDADAGSGGDTGASSSSSGGSAVAWATGGTAAMTASASYPDPFATTTAGASCVLAQTATEGPCTEAADQVRKDISEGFTGLPMRLALRVVDASCNPIAGAKVKVWHTQINGSYSGDTPNNGMCLKDQSDSSKHYFRGVQTTDANGRVDFDSCFPGWYRGRTVHIHFTVTLGSKSYTSQLVFDDTLVAELFASHAEYKGYGQPDTTNTNDNVVGRGTLASYVLATTRTSDGAMLASKQLVVAVT